MIEKKRKLSLFSKYTAVISVIFAASVVVGIALSSAVCDVLALGKNKSARATITINEINELAGALEEYDIVEHPLLFSVYVELCGLSKPLTVKNRTASVSADMDYKNLLAVFTSPPPAKTLTISFPEGATTDEIIDIFLKNGIGTREGFADAINNYPFEYDFIASLDQKISKDRLYRLDGYLYPDTYDFYTGRSEAYYIYKMLDRFCQISAELGVNTLDDDIVTVASMIQASCSNVSQFEYVSSAIHNRLRDPATYPHLACPATSAYALGISGLCIGAPTDDIKEVDSHYNTFINKGLPPGAICNPGKNALVAALCPADSPYKYYLTLENGSVVLARTEWEHNKNCEEFNPHS